MVAGTHNSGTFPECMYGLLERFSPASFGVNIQHYTPEGFFPIPGAEYARIIRGAFRFSMETGVFVDQVARRLLPLVTGEFRHRDCAAQGGKLVYRPDGTVSLVLTQADHRLGTQGTRLTTPGDIVVLPWVCAEAGVPGRDSPLPDGAGPTPGTANGHWL
jgi:hypothetical protein